MALPKKLLLASLMALWAPLALAQDPPPDGGLPGGLPGGIPSGNPKPSQSNDPKAPKSPEGLQTAVEAYETWLHRFDARFSEIEDRIAKTSQSLDNLEFEALGDIGSRCDATVSHYASTGAYFILEEIRYQIDGVPIISRLDSSGALGKSETFNVFSGRIIPGKHVLSVEMIFRVKGFDLLSSELRGARFRAKGSFVFEAKDNVLSTISVIGKDSSTDKPSGLTIAQVEKRFKISFTLKESKTPFGTSPASTPVSTPASTPNSTSAPAPSK